MPRLARVVVPLLCAVVQPWVVRAQEPHAAAGAEGTFPSLHVIGFTDVDFLATDDAGRQAGSSFFSGQFVLHVSSALSPRLTFVSELSLTPRPEAAFDRAAAAYHAEVERSLIKFTYRDWLKLSAGRHHTPVSYWNTAFHHGQWLQTTTARPDMVQFGGDFLPVHFVGALVEGNAPARGVNFNYAAGIGNGRSSAISRAGDALDVNGSRAWVIAGFARPDKFYGLQAGGAYYADTITSSGAEHGESIVALHLAWTKEAPEVIAEHAWVRHHDRAAGARTSHRAYYVQGAWRLSGALSKAKPYYRFEQMVIEPGDPVFGRMLDRTVHILGVRLDPADLLALKGEYRRERSPGAAGVNTVVGQVSFTF